uniref:RRM domain-containing protein n=1 Tax=Gouania willdenowi TaxID=441366 RepID=A0A8C5GAK8_GOUWI
TYNDCFILFVGNLPQDIDKRELKEFFMTYGNVVNLWINTKSVGGNLPNFGFVVFDTSDSVQRILEAQLEGPIMFQDKVHLKVKERKLKAVREQETRPHRSWSRDRSRDQILKVLVLSRTLKHFDSVLSRTRAARTRDFPSRQFETSTNSCYF